MKISDRLRIIIDYLEISQNEFGRKVGVSSTVISHWVTGRNEPSISKLGDIIKAFPQFRLDWLVMGEEPMLRDKDNVFQEGSPEYNTMQDRVKALEKQVLDLTEKIEHLMKLLEEKKG